MRTFAQIVPTFWMRGSGKKLRGKPWAQLVALYLMSNSESSMIGMYYVSRRKIVEEVGMPDGEFDQAIADVREVSIAFYDSEEELVFLPEGARHQIGPVLKAGDRKRPNVIKQLEVFGNHPFVAQWIARYHEPYALSIEGLRYPSDTPPIPLQTGAAAAPLSVPVLISGSQRSERPGVGAYPPKELPIVADLQTRSKLWVKDPTRAALQYPQPEQWTEMLELNNLVGEVFKFDPPVIRTSSDKGVQNVLKRWSEGHTQASMRQAVRGAAHSKTIKDTPEYQTLATIFTDSNCVDKYGRIAKPASAPLDKSNSVKLTPEAIEKNRKFMARE